MFCLLFVSFDFEMYNMFEFSTSSFFRKKLQVVVFLRVIINLSKSIEKIIKDLRNTARKKIKESSAILDF